MNSNDKPDAPDANFMTNVWGVFLVVMLCCILLGQGASAIALAIVMHSIMSK